MFAGTVYSHPVELFSPVFFSISPCASAPLLLRIIQDAFTATSHTQLIFTKYIVYLCLHCEIIKHSSILTAENIV